MGKSPEMCEKLAGRRVAQSATKPNCRDAGCSDKQTFINAAVSDAVTSWQGHVGPATMLSNFRISINTNDFSRARLLERPLPVVG
jgi:hypothetical protein